MKSKKKARPEPSALGAVIAAPKGAAVFTVASLILSLPASLTAYFTPDPGSYVLPCGLAALYISAAVGGFVSYKQHGGLALLTGLFCGLVSIAISLLLSLAIPIGYSMQPSPAAVFLTRLPILPISVVGACAASAKRKKKKRKKH